MYKEYIRIYIFFELFHSFIFLKYDFFETAFLSSGKQIYDSS